VVLAATSNLPVGLALEIAQATGTVSDENLPFCSTIVCSRHKSLLILYYYDNPLYQKTHRTRKMFAAYTLFLFSFFFLAAIVGFHLVYEQLMCKASASTDFVLRGLGRQLLLWKDTDRF
jgi:hypothetical protein